MIIHEPSRSDLSLDPGALSLSFQTKSWIFSI